MRLAAQLMLLPFSLFLPMVFRWGFKSALIRLSLLLVGVWYGVGLWRSYPEHHDTVVGWLVLAGVIVGVRPRFRRGGGGRAVVRDGGVGHGSVVPRRGGGMVVGPRPFDAGGTVTVVERGGRAVRGVAGRVGRGRRHLEVVGGTAVGNVAEGRLPWRSRAVIRAGLWAYVQPMAWLETTMRQRNRVRNGRAVDELRDAVEGQPGYAPTWVPGERRPPWREAADQLHRDVDRRRP
jgi:hypothetical protein